MKRTTVTIHASWGGGGETRRIRGWAADLYGIPVVLCRLGAHQDWHCVEPRTGRPLTGWSWPTRKAALNSARRRLDAHAAAQGLPPGEALEALVRHWLDRRHA